MRAMQLLFGAGVILTLSGCEAIGANFEAGMWGASSWSLQWWR